MAILSSLILLTSISFGIQEKPIPALIRELGVESEGNAVCNGAYAELVKKKDEAVPYLEPALQNQESEKIRYYAARCLGEINTSASRNLLIKAFDSEFWDVRCHVAMVLNWHPHNDAEQIYLDTLSDPDVYSKRSAINAAGEIRSKSAGPILKRIVERPDGWNIHYAAICALRKIEAKEHFPELEEALKFLKWAKFHGPVNLHRLNAAVGLIEKNIAETMPDVIDIYLYITKANETKVTPDSASIALKFKKIARKYISICATDKDVNISSRIKPLAKNFGQ